LLFDTKHTKIEILIFFYFFLLILKPVPILTLTLLSYLFGNWKYQLRFLIVQKAMDYFHPSEGKMEKIKKNLSFVKWVQTNVIFLCETIDMVFNG